MANQEHLHILKQGVKTWNQWREKYPDVPLDLREADLRGAQLEAVKITWAPENMTEDVYTEIDVSKGSQLEGVNLRGVNLRGAHLEGADLTGAHLEGVKLSGAHLEGARLVGAHLEAADLRLVFFDNATRLDNIILGNKELGFASLVDISWGGVNLAVIDWLKIDMLGDEQRARRQIENKKEPDEIEEMEEKKQRALPWKTVLEEMEDEEEEQRARRRQIENKKEPDEIEEMEEEFIIESNKKIIVDNEKERNEESEEGQTNEKKARLNEYRTAIRANRQLSSALQAQGLNEEAARFAYRAQKLQRTVLRWQRQLGRYIFSWFLALLTGYGYKPERTLYWYVSVIGLFAVAYYILGMLISSHLAWYEALILSLRNFHGRGFFSEQSRPGDPETIFAAIEAFLGLFIEAGLIAAFTQRVFGK